MPVGIFYVKTVVPCNRPKLSAALEPFPAEQSWVSWGCQGFSFLALARFSGKARNGFFVPFSVSQLQQAYNTTISKKIPPCKNLQSGIRIIVSLVCFPAVQSPYFPEQ